MKAWCISILAGAAILGIAPVHAQTTGAVAVSVVDAASGQALEAALVHLPALDLRGSSDEQGAPHPSRRPGRGA